jgi:hypothetical protein
VAFWRFDNDGAVLHYDTWIPTLTSYTNLQFGYRRSHETQQASIQTLCAVTQDLCTGANQQWNDVTSCVVDLSKKPYGDWNEAWADNVVCRSVHIQLAKLRPNVSHATHCHFQRVRLTPRQIHCMHVGPTGGGKCANVDYNQVYFNDDERLFGPGSPFICPKQGLHPHNCNNWS